MTLNDSIDLNTAFFVEGSDQAIDLSTRNCLSCVEKFQFLEGALMIECLRCGAVNCLRCMEVHEVVCKPSAAAEEDFTFDSGQPAASTPTRSAERLSSVAAKMKISQIFASRKRKANSNSSSDKANASKSSRLDPGLVATIAVGESTCHACDYNTKEYNGFKRHLETLKHKTNHSSMAWMKTRSGKSQKSRG